MSAPLNRQPVGLLGFFGIKNGGRYPQFLGETLAPVIGLRELYEVQRIDRGDLTPALVQTNVNVFGPAVISAPGPTWHVLEVSCEVDATTSGADVARLRLGIYNQPQACFVGVTDLLLVSNGGTPAGALHARDLWLGPDDQLAYHCVGLAGTPLISVEWRAVEYQQ